jgi:hypothetical protein
MPESPHVRAVCGAFSHFLGNASECGWCQARPATRFTSIAGEPRCRSHSGQIDGRYLNAPVALPVGGSRELVDLGHHEPTAYGVGGVGQLAVGHHCDQYVPRMLLRGLHRYSGRASGPDDRPGRRAALDQSTSPCSYPGMRITLWSFLDRSSAKRHAGPPCLGPCWSCTLERVTPRHDILALPQTR